MIKVRSQWNEQGGSQSCQLEWIFINFMYIHVILYVSPFLLTCQKQVLAILYVYVDISCCIWRRLLCKSNNTSHRGEKILSFLNLWNLILNVCWHSAPQRTNINPSAAPDIFLLKVNCMCSNTDILHATHVETIKVKDLQKEGQYQHVRVVNQSLISQHSDWPQQAFLMWVYFWKHWSSPHL